MTRAQDEIVKSLRLTGREEGQEVRGPEEIGNGKAELNMFDVAERDNKIG